MNENEDFEFFNLSKRDSINDEFDTLVFYDNKLKKNISTNMIYTKTHIRDMYVKGGYNPNKGFYVSYLNPLMKGFSIMFYSNRALPQKEGNLTVALLKRIKKKLEYWVDVRKDYENKIHNIEHVQEALDPSRLFKYKTVSAIMPKNVKDIKTSKEIFKAVYYLHQNKNYSNMYYSKILEQVIKYVNDDIKKYNIVFADSAQKSYKVIFEC